MPKPASLAKDFRQIGIALHPALSFSRRMRVSRLAFRKVLSAQTAPHPFTIPLELLAKRSRSSLAAAFCQRNCPLLGDSDRLRARP